MSGGYMIRWYRAIG